MKISLAVRSLFWVCLCPGTFGVAVPWILASRFPERLALGAWHGAGLPLMGIGAFILGWCVLDFAREGKGTLSPLDPPRSVVRGGPYRHVRNPMYLGVLTALLGEGLFFQSAFVLGWWVFVMLAFHLTVVLYEEPKPERTFGEAYEAYRREVPRWIPKFDSMLSA